MSCVWASLLAAVAVAEMVASEVPSCSALDSSCRTQADSLSMSLLQQEFALKQDRIVPGPVEESANPQTPFEAMRCKGTQVETTLNLTVDDYDSMINEMRFLYNRLPTSCNAKSCPQGDFAGCVLRLAAHDFMDYVSGDGGSDACISFDDPDNNGLPECLYKGDHGISVADAYEQFCTHVSLADFLVIAAEAVMLFSRENVLKDNPSRSNVAFRQTFKYGRTTKRKCANPDGLMPDPEKTCDDVRRVFVESMGLDWNLSAALMGAHTLGKAEVRYSGYQGSWKPLEISNRFDNRYYHGVLLKGWAPELQVGGNVLKNQWARVDFGMDENRLGKEMMLNTDLCLLYTASDPYDNVRGGVVQLRAHTGVEDGCECAWVSAENFEDAIKANGGEYCGVQDHPLISATLESQGGSAGVDSPAILPTGDMIALTVPEISINFTKERVLCCSLQGRIKVDPVDLTIDSDCGVPAVPDGYAHGAINTFAVDENAWLEQFTKAWHIATSNGYKSLKALDPSQNNDLSNENDETLARSEAPVTNETETQTAILRSGCHGFSSGNSLMACLFSAWVVAIQSVL